MPLPNHLMWVFSLRFMGTRMTQEFSGILLSIFHETYSRKAEFQRNSQLRILHFSIKITCFNQSCCSGYPIARRSHQQCLAIPDNSILQHATTIARVGFYRRTASWRTCTKNQTPLLHFCSRWKTTYVLGTRTFHLG